MCCIYTALLSTGQTDNPNWRRCCIYIPHFLLWDRQTLQTEGWAACIYTALLTTGQIDNPIWRLCCIYTALLSTGQTDNPNCRMCCIYTALLNTGQTDNPIWRLCCIYTALLSTGQTDNPNCRMCCIYTPHFLLRDRQTIQTEGWAPCMSIYCTSYYGTDRQSKLKDVLHLYSTS